MEKVPDLGTFLKKMNKKLLLRTFTIKTTALKIFNKFKKHILDFHGSGSSIHEENGFFKVDQKFRKNLKIEKSE